MRRFMTILALTLAGCSGAAPTAAPADDACARWASFHAAVEDLLVWSLGGAVTMESFTDRVGDMAVTWHRLPSQCVDGEAARVAGELRRLAEVWVRGDADMAAWPLRGFTLAELGTSYGLASGPLFPGPSPADAP